MSLLKLKFRDNQMTNLTSSNGEKLDMKSMSSKDLDKLKGDIEDALKTYGPRMAAQAMKEISPILQKYDITIADILDFIKQRDRKKPKGSAKVKKSKSKKKSPPMFENPDDKTLTWSGKGRPPVWFREKRDGGIDPESMRIPV
jgi:DNA-binding protein H-NS